MRRMVILCCAALLVAGCAGASGGGGGEPVPPFHPGTVTATETGPANSFTVVATGDVLIHPALTAQAEEERLS